MQAMLNMQWIEAQDARAALAHVKYDQDRDGLADEVRYVGA
jgi:hypothetical protein